MIRFAQCAASGINLIFGFIQILSFNLSFGAYNDKCFVIERDKKCPGFGDKPHLTSCCPSKVEIGDYYCCTLEEKRRTEADWSNTFINNVTEILGGIAFAVLITCTLVVFCCFFCDGCYWNRRRRKNCQNANNYSIPPPRQPHAGDVINECFTCSGERFMTTNYATNLRQFYQIPIFEAGLKPFEAPPPYPVTQECPFVAEAGGLQTQDPLINVFGVDNDLPQLPIDTVDYERENLLNHNSQLLSQRLQ